MNAPPIGIKTIKHTDDSGDPLVVRYEYMGKKYKLIVVTSIGAIWPTGGRDALGNPEFSMQITPTVTVTLE